MWRKMKMKKKRFLLAVLLLCMVGRGTMEPVRGCLAQPNCTECLRSPGCAWCKQKNFLKSGEPNERRCDTAEALIKRNCGKKDVINPQPALEFMKNNHLQSDPENVVQIQPQNVHLKLRIGVPKTFQVTFKRAEGYPIDLYYLMDLSYSMKDDLEKIKHLGQEILSTLERVTKKVRIGFGSFVDKVAMPYVSQVKPKLANPCPSRMDTCQPAFSFQNVLPLTGDAEKFKVEVSKQRISGNLDSPEAGFDAMMQAAVCQEHIGWNNVTRILVYTSDDIFHMAGDGRLAGIYQPNDGKCHLNHDGFYSDASKYDYPSVGRLSSALSANNIQLIFAVTENSFSSYQALSKLIPQSVVGVLKNDSSNVVQLISEAYGNLSSTILLEHLHAPKGLEVLYKAQCSSGNHTQWQEHGKCNDVKINKQVNFTVSLTAAHCFPEAKTFTIKPQGIGEELKVTVETLCDCNCNDKEVKSSHCSYNGTLSCGMCSCDGMFLGQRCECEANRIGDSMRAMEAHCRETNTSQLCSGQGSCECGRCMCWGNHRGEYCECDDSDCPKVNDLLCGGHGTCNCSVCKCEGDFTGPDCGCSTLRDRCVGKDGVECNNFGNCTCNKCICEEGFFKDDCSELIAPCEMFRDCAVCTISNDKGGGQNCDLPCQSAELVKNDSMPEKGEFPCRYTEVQFEVKPEKGHIKIFYAGPPKPLDMTMVVVGSSISGILFVGLAIIIIYRLLLELYYRREYHSFLKEQQSAKWDETPNPLFQGATTTVYNPMHVQS
ncbi:hypothetical protein AGOR_G00162260 [Albula goreensis]|uniref:Integrin beta n=1 Tax=Albula goreensis TaxID=1534307 RepID=A0A8T3D8U0_9TELE|nr:hypothetical protein AGOR_G00162260 [Albula goreensis]